MSQQYNSKYSNQLVKLLLTSIDDVEMRRLKEGFYGIMKLSNHIKDKPDFKQQLIDFAQVKIEKPQSEAIIQLSSNLNDDQDNGIVQVEDINIGIDNNDKIIDSSTIYKPKNTGFVKKNLTIGAQNTTQDTNTQQNNIIDQQQDNQQEEEKKQQQPSYIPGKQRAKQKGKKTMAPPSFKKKLQLNVGAGNGDKDDGAEELPKSLQQQQEQEELKQEQIVDKVEETIPQKQVETPQIQQQDDQQIKNNKNDDINDQNQDNSLQQNEQNQQNMNQNIDIDNKNQTISQIQDINNDNNNNIITYPQNRYTKLEQKVIILTSIINNKLKNLSYQQVFKQLYSQSLKLKQNVQLNSINKGMQTLNKVIKQKNNNYYNELLLKMKTLAILSYEDNHINSNNILLLQDRQRIKIINIIGKYKQQGKINKRYYFYKWLGETKLLQQYKNVSDTNNNNINNNNIMISNSTFQQLAFDNKDNIQQQNEYFNNKNTGAIRIIRIINDINIRKQREAFELIEHNCQLFIMTYFDQIKQNLQNLEEYIEVIQNKENDNEIEQQYYDEEGQLETYKDNQQYLRYLNQVLQEAKDLFKLYGKIVQQKYLEKSIKKIDYTEDQKSQKMKSVVKIFQIFNRFSFVDKSVLRRVRIWHSKGLREEMRILCSSLQKCQKQEKRINMIILMQFQKVRMQYFFYLWQENIVYDKHFSMKSIRSFQLNSTQLRSTSSNALNKRTTPQSFSIDETQNNKTRTGAAGIIQNSNKRQQHKMMMGSFDLDSRSQNNNSSLAQNFKQNKQGQTRMTSYGSINNNSSNISSNINPSQIKHTLITHNPAFDTMDRQHLIDIKAKSLFNLSKILIERGSQTQLSNYIRTITNISNQSAKYKKAIMLSQEVQNIIAESCKFIFQTVFRKWVIIAHHRGRIILDKQQGITRMFNLLHRKNRLLSFDSLLRMHKYQLHIQRKAGDLNNQTQYASKLSNIQVASFVIQKLSYRFKFKSTLNAFQKWKFMSSFNNQRQTILEQSFNSINRSLSEVFTPKRQNGKLPYEDPLMKERLKRLSTIGSTVQIVNILERPSQVRDVNTNVEKLEIYKYLNKWIQYTIQNRDENKIKSKLTQQMNDTKFNIIKRLHQQLSKTSNRQINNAFQKWKLNSYNSQKNQDMKIIEQVDQGIIQVQAQVGQDLERQLLKQQEQVKLIKKDKILIKLIDIYDNQNIIQTKTKSLFHQWAKNIGLRMDFGRITKYLEEIDISNNEKRDLENRVQQINDENEQIQHKMHHYTLSISCETCRQLMQNKAIMISQQQNERRSQVWDMYSNQESEVRRIDDNDDDNRSSRWNDSTYDNIRRLTSDDGDRQGSSRNLTGRSAKVISNRHLQQQQSVRNIQSKMHLEIQDMDESKSQQEEDSDMQSSIVMRLAASGQDDNSIPNSSKNASIKFFRGDGNNLNTSSHQNLFNNMLNMPQRQRVSTQIRRIYDYPEQMNLMGDGQSQQQQDNDAPSQSNASGSTQMIKIDAQSQFSMNTMSQNQQMSIMKSSDDSKSQFSRQSFKNVYIGGMGMGGHALMNPHQNNYLKELSIYSGGGTSSSDQQQLINANNMLQNNIFRNGSQLQLSNNSNNDTTEMKRMSSQNTFSDFNVPSSSGGMSFLNENTSNNAANKLFNRRFSRISDAGTIIEEADPEQFGNDLVLQLELENSELRMREEQLKTQLQRKIQEHQKQKEAMLKKLKELEEKRNALTKQNITQDNKDNGNFVNKNAIDKMDITVGSGDSSIIQRMNSQGGNSNGNDSHKQYNYDFNSSLVSL